MTSCHCSNNLIGEYYYSEQISRCVNRRGLVKSSYMYLRITPFIPFVQVGDGTNFVLILAGALLEHAEDLLRMGLSPTEVIEGYEMAAEKALDILPSKDVNFACSVVVQVVRTQNMK